MIPKPFYSKKADICLWYVDFPEADGVARKKRQAAKVAMLTPFSFQPSFYSTTDLTLGGNSITNPSQQFQPWINN